jgi:hypothetical protein
VLQPKPDITFLRRANLYLLHAVPGTSSQCHVRHSTHHTETGQVLIETFSGRHISELTELGLQCRLYPAPPNTRQMLAICLLQHNLDLPLFHLRCSCRAWKAGKLPTQISHGSLQLGSWLGARHELQSRPSEASFAS